MATVEKPPQVASPPLAPPEERFWKRYSPHYEMPLAGATSLFVHGMVIGVLALGGLVFLLHGNAEAHRPPQMDVLVVEGEGLGGMGGGAPGLPGFPGEPSKTEMAIGPPGPSGPQEPGEEVELPPVPGMELELPSQDTRLDSSSLLAQLTQIGEDASKRSETKLPSSVKSSGSKKAGSSGTGNPKGVGGQGGVGGAGKGTMPGPGSGVGIGRKATEQEIKAWRWKFDLQGSPKQHADKLDRAGLIVAVPDPAAGQPDMRKGPHLFITDLKRRPVAMEKRDLAQYEDAVKWYNRTPQSVQGLAQELKLPFVPPYVVLLLPKDREAKMAAEEHRFAKQNRNDVSKVQETWFDFRLQGGVYEPMAIRQK